MRSSAWHRGTLLEVQHAVQRHLTRLVLVVLVAKTAPVVEVEARLNEVQHEAQRPGGTGGEGRSRECWVKVNEAHLATLL